MSVVEDIQTPLDEALLRMENLHPKVIDLTLGRLQRVLDTLGNPEKKLPPFIHVAGTNGKGSTVAYLRAFLEAEGHTVHCFTSPHLVRFNERIRLSGEIISDEALIDLIEICEDANDGGEITFFEIAAAVAFQGFATAPADILLLEVGLGGRFDATNVVDTPAVSTITPVSIDHVKFLGNTISQIALDKAGILKHGAPGAVGPQTDIASRIIEAYADEVGAPLFMHDRDWWVERIGEGFRWHDNRGHDFLLPAPALVGPHQFENAGTAIASAICLADLDIHEPALREGLGTVNWPARVQLLEGSPLARLLPDRTELWLDGGHNPAAGQIIGETLAGMPRDRDNWLILGMLQSKDTMGFLRPIAPEIKGLVAVPLPGKNAGTLPEETVDIGERLGIESFVAEDSYAAARLLGDRIGGHARVLICGSLRLAGEVLGDIPGFRL